MIFYYLNRSISYFAYLEINLFRFNINFGFNEKTNCHLFSYSILLPSAVDETKIPEAICKNGIVKIGEKRWFDYSIGN